jgi:micrococcal nuclease
VWLILSVLVWVAVRVTQDSREPTPPEALPEAIYGVERVADGDTLVLANGARVRLIGVDTPEVGYRERPPEPWADEAARFTERFVADGQVRLRFDLERRDKHDRFLAYVYVGAQMLNEELLRAGLARARTEFRYTDAMKRAFRRAEAEAKEARRGIWSEG